MTLPLHISNLGTLRTLGMHRTFTVTFLTSKEAKDYSLHPRGALLRRRPWRSCCRHPEAGPTAHLPVRRFCETHVPPLPTSPLGFLNVSRFGPHVATHVSLPGKRPQPMPASPTVSEAESARSACPSGPLSFDQCVHHLILVSSLW